ncbi:hypothetical protein FRC15_000732, partial [Serendipita sp. 397]
ANDYEDTNSPEDGRCQFEESSPIFCALIHALRSVTGTGPIPQDTLPRGRVDRALLGTSHASSHH